MIPVREFPTAYEVTVWPEGTECADSATWCLTVAYRGLGLCAVMRGSGDTGRTCLGVDGEWDWEMSPSNRTDEWLAGHRFALDEALALAREHAPKVTVNGMTAAEVAERHHRRHGGEPCNG